MDDTHIPCVSSLGLLQIESFVNPDLLGCNAKIHHCATVQLIVDTPCYKRSLTEVWQHVMRYLRDSLLGTWFPRSSGRPYPWLTYQIALRHSSKTITVQLGLLRNRFPWCLFGWLRAVAVKRQFTVVAPHKADTRQRKQCAMRGSARCGGSEFHGKRASPAVLLPLSTNHTNFDWTTILSCECDARFVAVCLIRSLQ